MRFIIKLIGIILTIVILLSISVILFVKLAPQFGSQPNGSSLAQIKKSENYREGVFQNLIETKMEIKAKDMAGTMWEMLFHADEKGPKKPLPVHFSSLGPMLDTTITITWYGHSAVLLEIDNQRILLDPMLGPASSPVSFGAKRFAYEKEIDLSFIQDIDAVIFSHDHYDHLDYPTVMALKDRVAHFYTALGVGSHLQSWGVAPEKITELDWWNSASFDNLEFICTPARHFSGRGLTDRNKTQWASWVVIGKKQKVYFSGDSGYGPHFQEIGEKYGPFDFAMIECGQYNALWESIHMMPEQSAQAILDLKAEVAMPIHWGAFTLSLHHWTEPIKRFQVAAKAKNLSIIHPFIGERTIISDSVKSSDWWEGY